MITLFFLFGDGRVSFVFSSFTVSMQRGPSLCYATICYDMLCYDMLCYVTICYAMLRYAMLFSLRHGAIRYEA